MQRVRTTTAFCGVPLVRLGDVALDAAAAVIGAGSALGTPHHGAENGPFFLRTVSKAYTWSAQEPALFDLRHGRARLDGAVDVGDLEFGDMTLPQVLETICATVGALPPEVVPCVIGGDHSITLAVVQALSARRARPFTVVQFDHHLDLQIWDGAPAREDAAREPIFNTNVMSHVSDLVGQGRLIQVGVSPYATVEASSADAMGAYLRSVGRQVCLSAPEIDDADAFRAVVGTRGDVYLTVDIDVLDRTEMSSVGYPAEVGLSTRRLLRLIDLALENNRLIGFDLVEFAAAREDRTARTLADAERAALVFLHLLSWVCEQADPDRKTKGKHDAR